VPRKRKKKNKYLFIRLRQHRFKVLLDKVLIFRFVRNLHGRFWGVAGISLMTIGFAICFAIRPDLLHISTAFSDFGNDVRTAPYFAGSVFIAAYGLWRWRNYLGRTVRRAVPLQGLITLTIVGLYMVALMPISWEPWPRRIHIIGVAIAGLSMLATVVLDGILSKTRRTKYFKRWRLVRITSFGLIVAGGWLTLGSIRELGWYNVALLGETMMLAGYALWVSVKTYQGEGSDTRLARLMRRIVIVR
jgi:hypothetical protein